MKKHSPRYIIDLARDLRRTMTESERILWARLRNDGIDGARFRRQHPIGRYIVDFCCHAKKLVIEIDGPIHANSREYDACRDAFLEGAGYRIEHFTNDDVENDIENVVEKIRGAMK